jgi:hypothetical protein
MVSAATLLAPRMVLADCQPAGPIEQELRTADVAFVGIVRATRADATVAIFEVEEVWRGSLGEAVEVRGLSDDDRPSEDDRTWIVGQRYLVLPMPFEGALVDNICTATTEWREELAELRPADAHSPPATPAAESGVPGAVLVAAAAFLVLAVVGFIAFRREKP